VISIKTPNKCKFEPMKSLLLISLVLFLACEVKQDTIYGCTNEDANNFNQEATYDDNSCEYSYDGDWEGRTSQERGFGLTIKSNKITFFNIVFIDSISLGDSSDNCSAGISAHIKYIEENNLIENNTFDFQYLSSELIYEFSGDFMSTDSAIGTAVVTDNIDMCTTGNLMWYLTKQIDSSG